MGNTSDNKDKNDGEKHRLTEAVPLKVFSVPGNVLSVLHEPPLLTLIITCEVITIIIAIREMRTKA